MDALAFQYRIDIRLIPISYFYISDERSNASVLVLLHWYKQFILHYQRHVICCLRLLLAQRRRFGFTVLL